MQGSVMPVRNAHVMSARSLRKDWKLEYQAASRRTIREQLLRSSEPLCLHDQSCSDRAVMQGIANIAGEEHGVVMTTPLILQVTVQEGNQLRFREGANFGRLYGAILE